MRILWFANTPCGALPRLTGKPVTGGGWLNALSEELGRCEGVELHIAFYWGKPLSPFEEGGITYHPVLRSGSSSKLGRYLHRVRAQFSSASDDAEVSRCVEVVQQVKPDLIHIHGSEENFGLIAEQVKDIPIVLSIQGLLNPIRLKAFAGFPLHDCIVHESLLQRLMMEGAAAGARRSRLSAKREQRIFRAVRHVIGRTEWDRRCSLALAPGRHYYKVDELLRGAFSVHEWHSRQAEDSVYRLVTTISNGLYKGVESLLRVATVLQQAGFTFEWHIIGLKTQDANVRRTKQIYGIDAEKLPIVFHGRCSAEQMVEIMLKADTYVQVSHIDNSPNSLCEAMLLGMPCIATFAGGTSDMLKDREEGTLVQDGEPYVMAGAIMEYAADPQKAQRLGAAARARALHRHNPERVLGELMAVYKLLTETK